VLDSLLGLMQRCGRLQALLGERVSGQGEAVPERLEIFVAVECCAERLGVSTLEKRTLETSGSSSTPWRALAIIDRSERQAHGSSLNSWDKEKRKEGRGTERVRGRRRV
jgi:hypothetical protein